MSFYMKVIGGFALLLLAALAFLFLFRTSDEKAIENLLEKGLRAAEAGDAEGVIALLSPNYKNGDETRDRVAHKIRQVVTQRLPFPKLEGSAIQVSGDDAEANAKVAVGPPQLRRTFSLKLKLKKESGVWKVTSADEAGGY